MGLCDVDTFIGEIYNMLNALKKLCGNFSKSATKVSALKVIKIIQSATSRNALNMEEIMEPFFIAAQSNDSVKYWPVIINCFDFVFTQAKEVISPKLQSKMMQAIFGLVRINISDEIRLKSVDAIMKCLNSANGRYFVHGTLLRLSVLHFVQMLNQVENQISKGSVAKILDATVKMVLNKYQQPLPLPKFDTVEAMSQFVATSLVNNALIIQQIAPDITSAHIQDIDLMAAIQALCTTISNQGIPAGTVKLACQILLQILESDSEFLATECFARVLINDIHVALLSITLDSRQNLGDVAAKLIITVWNRFAKLYSGGLNDLLVRGIAAAMSSPYPEVAMRSFVIVQNLVSAPQFLVDCFVNYDCDQSGLFKNVFENSIDQIIKKSYPGQKSVNLQKAGLKTLVKVLESLWKYWKSFDGEDVKAKKEEAQMVLDQKKAKMTLESAQDLFKRNPNKGLKCFADNKICEDTPESYADFLFNTPQLDPVAVGEVLGGSKELNLKILPLYVGKFNFKGMTFEQGFRTFLSKFHIPGESQMIDRVMEQFGTKFYNDNSESFSCADTVYVLAFSTLMLHTDAHHPNVKHHMTLDEFIRNNAGIDRGKDLPREYLEQLYKGITSEKIFSSATEALPSQSLLTRRQQAELYQAQCAQTLELARKRTNDMQKHEFQRAVSQFLIGPMFDTIWRGTIAALSMSFEASDETELVNTCLMGFQLCTHIASHCYIEDALDTLVDSFAKFTRLESKLEASVLKPKNFMCTKALIDCATQDRKVLKGAWEIVLREISALDKLKDNKNVVTDMRCTRSIFLHTESLDRESIIDFVSAMCTVSRAELRESPPRQFMLLQLQDVCIWNMNRPMYIWKDIWDIAGRHLSSDVCIGNGQIADGAVNIIRQMAQSFLPRQEMSQYHFQQQFLQPFCDIFDGGSPFKVKELILHCLSQIVSNLASVLHSGWTVILQILTSAIVQDSLKGKGFVILEMIITEHRNYVKPYFDHLLAVLYTFITSDPNSKIAPKAVSNFSIAASCLAPDDNENWDILLMTLARCFQSPRFEIIQAAQENLFLIILNHCCAGNEFSDYIWEIIFSKTVFALVNYGSSTTERMYWHHSEVLNDFINKIFDPYKDNFVKYQVHILNLFKYCCATQNEKFRDESLRALARFVSITKDAFNDPEMTQSLLGILRSLVESLLSSVLFVEVLSTFVSVFEDKPEVTDELLSVIEKISAECNKNRSDSIVQCWCYSRQEFLKGVIIKRRDEQMCNHFRESIGLYFEMAERDADLKYWNELLVSCLKQIASLDDERFGLCVNSSLELLCELVEVNSELVRAELVPVLSRKLVCSVPAQ